MEADDLKVHRSELSTRADGKIICVGDAIELERGKVPNAAGLTTQFASFGVDVDQSQGLEVTASHKSDARKKARVAEGGQWRVGVTAGFLKDEAKGSCGFLEPKPRPPTAP